MADACPNEETRQHVKKLLQADSKVGDSFLERPIQTTHSSRVDFSSQGGLGSQPGDQIGRYTVREMVGEGGMGIVYVAEIKAFESGH